MLTYPTTDEDLQILTGTEPYAGLNKRRAKHLLTGFLRALSIEARGTWTEGDEARAELIIDCVCTPLEARIQELEGIIRKESTWDSAPHP